MNSQWKHVALVGILGLSLVGCGGSSSKDPITAPVENVVQKQVSALILTAEGNSLTNATIRIEGQSFSTNRDGKANFTVNIPKNAAYIVVKIEKNGFVTQSLRLKADELDSMSARLLAVKSLITVAAIEEAQMIESHQMNASIAIPANAFVRPNGQLATGQVTVEFSPWDIQSQDLNAMPANGVAQNAQNQIVDLISAGMISATFKNAQGEILQLATGKSADLRMDLPVSSIQNQDMQIGTEIPMWHFDEVQGLWIEEGVGHVVQSNQSATGLAVHATVTHFSTWNWDFQYLGASSIFVQCFADNVAAPCYVNANANLSDGSRITRSSYISAQGTRIVNMPSSGEINWSASHPNDTNIAEITSVLPNNVRIDLRPAKTNNFVRCLKDNAYVDCVVSLNGRDYTVAAEGSMIRTQLDTPQLQWQARSQYSEGATAVYRYSGQASSNTRDDVTIVLDQETKLFDKTPFDLRCQLDGEANLPCQVSLYTWSTINGMLDEGVYGEKHYNLLTNQSMKVYLPVMQLNNDQSNFNIDGQAIAFKDKLQRYGYFDYENLKQQKIHFNFNNTSWCTPWEGPVDLPDIEVPMLLEVESGCWNTRAS